MANEMKGKKFRDVCPTVENVDIIQGPERQCEVVLFGILTGHCRLHSDLYLINKHKDGLCMACKVQEMTDPLGL